ncbi:hypothetical protein B5807_11174 [Epicoccum nigrum]|uniref:Uncharacterized protein n=1 Tax=Epicoccum nigrum TaxID=105696 RepID=A0A1Y2LJN3_EPING|nr:hypothetical protein B5807_11174 [Epicoccum nigrum]
MLSGGKTKTTIDDFLFKPGSKEYRTAQLRTEEQLENWLPQLDGLGPLEHSTHFMIFARSVDIEVADEENNDQQEAHEEESDEKSDDDSDDDSDEEVDNGSDKEVEAEQDDPSENDSPMGTP